MLCSLSPTLQALRMVPSVARAPHDLLPLRVVRVVFNVVLHSMAHAGQVARGVVLLACHTSTLTVRQQQRQW